LQEEEEEEEEAEKKEASMVMNFFYFFSLFDVQVGWWLFFSQIPMTTTQKGNWTLGLSSQFVSAPLLPQRFLLALFVIGDGKDSIGFVKSSSQVSTAFFLCTNFHSDLSIQKNPRQRVTNGIILGESSFTGCRLKL
jgi:hypothetical protein